MPQTLLQLAAALTVTEMHAIDRAWIKGEKEKEIAVEEINTELGFYKLGFGYHPDAQMALMVELARN